MNRFVLGALAFSAASTLGNASESEDWAGLDRELETLRATMAASSSGSAVGASGFIRSSYLWSKDARGGSSTGPAAAPGHPLNGFSIDNVRLNLSATVDEFDVFVQLEASTEAQFNTGANSGTGAPLGVAPSTPVRLGNRTPTARAGVGGGVAVLDAYASWNIQDEIKLTVGQFRAPVSRGAMLDEDGLFFIERSATDLFWATRDQGIQLSGQVGPVSYAAGVQNGGMHVPTNPAGAAGDGVGNDVAYFGRVDVNILGDGPGRVEGALKAPDDTAVTAGLSYYRDESFEDSTAITADAVATFGIIAVWGQAMWLDDAYNNSANEELLWNLAATFEIVEDAWEVGARYENFNDSMGVAGTSGNQSANQLTLGVNHYINGTHNAKVSANYSHIHAARNAAVKETDLFAVGLTLSW